LDGFVGAGAQHVGHRGGGRGLARRHFGFF
jgi:hypothetical protein